MTEPAPQESGLLLPDRSCLVHIGPYKTGTTALQASLFAARPALRAMGVIHAGNSRHPARSVQAVIGRVSSYSDDAKPSIVFWKALVREIRRGRNERVVLSSEFLALGQPDAIRRIRDDIGAERMHVVVTLRPLARILPSMWQQNVRAGSRASLDKWAARLLPELGGSAEAPFWQVHRHDELIRRWADVVGIDRVTVVVVSDTDRMMLLRTFESLLGLVPDTLAPQPRHTNRSLTAEEAEAIRALNVAYAATGLGKALHTRLIRRGAAEYLTRLRPAAGAGTIELPAAAIEPVRRVAAEMVARIAESGVRVLGDIGTLAWVPETNAAASQGSPRTVTSETAARLAMGVLCASGRARSGRSTVEAIPTAAEPALAAESLHQLTALQLGYAISGRIRTRPVRPVSSPKRSRSSSPGRVGAASAVEAASGGQPGAQGEVASDALILCVGPSEADVRRIQAAILAADADGGLQGVHCVDPSRASAGVRAVLDLPRFPGSPPPRMAEWKAVLREIRASRRARTILGSSAFADATPERLHGAMADLDAPRVHVVVTLPSLAALLASEWARGIETGEAAAYEPWLDALLNARSADDAAAFWARSRGDALVARWASAVGADRVTVVGVDEPWTGEAWAALERLLGLREGTLAPPHDPVDRQLTSAELEALRALNGQVDAAGLSPSAGSASIAPRVAGYLRAMPGDPLAASVELPGWAIPHVAEIDREVVAGIRSAGVRSIGVGDHLSAGTARRGDGIPEAAGVSPVVAARLAMGTLFACSVAQAPEPDAPKPSRRKWRSIIEPVHAEPIEIVRLPTGMLVRELAGRPLRHAFRRRAGETPSA